MRVATWLEVTFENPMPTDAGRGNVGLNAGCVPIASFEES